MIPLLTRIENALAQCPDPALRAELEAERAIYFARIGEFDAAGRILTELRTIYGGGRSARISIWIMLIEGLILFFKDTDSGARDRIFRAYTIGHACALADLSKLAAAWLAHIEFNRSEFESMIRFLRICSETTLESNNSTGLRASLVLADAHMHAGQIQDAKIWYERARHLAINLGDEASLAAVIYNKAALGLSRIRLSVIDGEVDRALIQFVAMEVASAHNFHHGARHRSLTRLIDACRARILLMQGSYAEALEIFRSLLSDGSLPLGFRSDRLLLQVEYGTCLAMVGFRDDAVTLLEDMDVKQCDEMSIDDQFIFVSSYISLARHLEIGVDRRVNEVYLNRCRELYTKDLVILREGLRAFVS
jgi:tetratricopeptide (TPR) repeat protein